MPPTTTTTTTTTDAVNVMDMNGRLSSNSTGVFRRHGFFAGTMPLTLFTLIVLAICAGLVPGMDAKPTPDSDWDRAMDYYKRLHVDWSCHVPQPRVIPVQQVHPDAGVAYVTTCVVLHRCAADAGCCPETDVCVAKDQETIDIPVITHDARRPYRMLTFPNHTSCHCVPKRKVLNDDKDADYTNEMT